MFSQMPWFRVSERAAACGLLGALACLAGCSSDVGDLSGTLFVATGQEADTWTADPVPVSLEVDLVGTKSTQIATATAPASTVSLGTGTPAETTAAFELTGFDANEQPVLHGRSVTYAITTFANSGPVVFAARTGGVSRAPGNLLFEYRHPLVEVVGHAFLLVAGGDSSSATNNPFDIYDASVWGVAPEQTWLTSAPKSWAVAGPNLLAVNDDGATSTDLTAGTVTTETPPSGFAFADIVGGKTFVAGDDTRYIVGATRTLGSATASVLRVATDGTLSAMKLSAPRLGAAAGIVNGQLVVAGGSESAAGVETLNAAGTAFVPLAYPPDPLQGAALAQLDSTTAILAGGVDADGTGGGLRTLDVACAASCSTQPLPDLDFAFSSVQAFGLADEQVLVCGESDDGQTHLFTLEKGSDFALTEVGLRTPRRGATLVAFPNGQIGLVGGDAVADGSPAASVELYFPPL